VWQRGNSPTPLSATDLTAWQNNYGTSGGANMTNARLFQKVPAVPGDTYTFQGTSEFEEDYSGFVTTLDASGPFGAIPSPTVTQFKMEFLNAMGNVIGSPTILDLRTEQTFPDFPVVHSPLVAVAPAGAQDVRVVAEALNMVYNDRADTVDNFQSAFFNDFSLTRSGDPGTPLLQNGDLNLGTPSALDFWNRVETACCNNSVQSTAGFANHTPGGTLGVWLSAFYGGWTETDGVTFVPGGNGANPVDGSISQTVAAVPGGVYNFSGWMKFEQNYSGGVDIISSAMANRTIFDGQASPTQSLITLEFLDNTGAVIQTSVIDVKEERQALASCGGNANSQVCGPAGNGWTQHTFNNVVAPANAVQVRLRADMIDGVYNTDPQQSAFWDDFSLTGPAPPLSSLVSVPEPTSMVLITLGFGAVLMGLGRNRK
jgi:hypothetical protein